MTVQVTRPGSGTPGPTTRRSPIGLALPALTALVVGLLYFDLRVRKESLDVMTLDRELRAAAP